LGFNSATYEEKTVQILAKKLHTPKEVATIDTGNRATFPR